MGLLRDIHPAREGRLGYEGGEKNFPPKRLGSLFVLDVAGAFQVTRIQVEYCRGERFAKARKSEPKELLRSAEAARGISG